jgi:uncharacterized pyridoxamine 5'-phosphate oxidase family protein
MDDVIRNKLVRLFEAQKFAILATDCHGKPYTSIIAFAVAQDLSQMIFVTPRNTAKYANLTANPNVAIFVDNRSNDMSDFENAIGVTSTGTAAEFDISRDTPLAQRYVLKNPNLERFLFSAENAAFCVTLKEYHIVENFQDVTRISLN